MLVEDEENLRDALRELIELTGRRCVEAGSCAEALELAKTHAVSCALVDLGLGGESGLDLLPQLAAQHPKIVPIILTGDSRSETIIDTMRAGAFDFLVKPVDSTLLHASIAKAAAYHTALVERDRLVEELELERQQLAIRVEEATADLRELAEQRERIYRRNDCLLRLTEFATDFCTDETLFEQVLKELMSVLPVRAVVLRSPEQEEYCAAVDAAGEGGMHYIATQRPESAPARTATDLIEDERGKIADWLRDNTSLDPDLFVLRNFPQSFWNRHFCTVSFLLAPSPQTDDEGLDEFLSMCAHFLAFEWQESRLFLHAVKEASLGNIAMEMSRGLIQSLTAIRTAADFVGEQELDPDAREGLDIIGDNVEILRRQIGEFRLLSSPKRDAVETVRLDEYVDQALEMLSTAVTNRSALVRREYSVDSSCVLLNGTTLARTILDLVTNAVRTVETGGTITIRIGEQGEDSLGLDVSFRTSDRDVLGSALLHDGPQTGSLYAHPQFMLIQRSVHSCGGQFAVDFEGDGRVRFRITVPRTSSNRF